MNRRDMLKMGAALPVVAVMGAARSLSTSDKRRLPPVVAGQVLTAEYMNQIIQRLNDLSESP